MLRLLQFGLMAYGAEPRIGDIPALERYFEYTISKTDPERRALMARELTARVETSKISFYAFLPILVVERKRDIVVTATIDFVSCSPFNDNGELCAIGELRDLFRGRAIANPGAVFGALVTMGERRFADFLDSIEPLLTNDELDVAARVHTPFLKPTEVSYWLHLANKFAAEGPGTSGQRFGSCALAIALARRDIRSDRVIEGQRDFPCRGKENPIRIIQETTVDEYAESIVPELYELEAIEAPPKLFSHVLRTWGYEPQALLVEQFFPPSDRTEQEFTRLRKRPMPSA